MAFAAPAAVTSSFMEEGCRRLRGLGDLVRTDAARADLDALGAATDDGANHLKVGLEAAGAHVVRVGDAAAHHRTFTADFTLHCHCRKLLETGKQKILSRFRRAGNSLAVFATYGMTINDLSAGRGVCGRCWNTRPTRSR